MQKIKLPNAKNHPVMDGDFLTPCYHASLVKHFFIGRLRLALGFMQNEKFNNLLEIGCGSGVFFPQLKEAAHNVYAADINPKLDSVKKMCELENLNVRLSGGSILVLPYKDDAFDCVVVMSTLEHIEQLDKAISEIHRVLKKNGRAIIGFPVSNIIADFLLRLMGSETDHNKKLDEIHPSSHRDIIDMIKKVFDRDVAVRTIPGFVPLGFSLYCCCCCIKG